MLNILISFLTFVLILISLFMVLVILMQRASSNAGMGSAFGGGVTESAFGAETTNILTRATKWSAFAFFIISLVLYLLFMSRKGDGSDTSMADLPDIPVATQTVPALPETAPAEATAADALSQEMADEAIDPSVAEPAAQEAETVPAP